MTIRPCLLCEYFKAIKPADTDWKPGYHGDEYGLWDVRRVMRETNGMQQRGQCMLNPARHEVWTSHTCSHYRPGGHALVTLRDFIWGDHWQQTCETARQQVADLTRQLKASRKISRGQLDRIQQLESKLRFWRARDKRNANAVSFDGRDHRV